MDNPDVLEKIFLLLSPKDLGNVYRVSIKFLNMDINYFWNRKICLDYSPTLISYTTEYKELYKYLYTSSYDKDIISAKPVLLEWYKISNQLKLPIKITDNMPTESIKWIIINKIPFDGRWGVDKDYRKRILETEGGIEFLYNNNVHDLKFIVLRTGSLEDIKWLHSKGVIFARNHFTDILVYRDLYWEDIFHYKCNNGYDKSEIIYTTFENSMKCILQSPKFSLELLYRLEKYFNKTLNYIPYFSTDMVDEVRFINLLIDRNIKINKKNINRLSSTGKLETLKVIEHRCGILPNKKGANYAAAYNYIDILDWLKPKNILPGRYGYFESLEQHYMNEDVGAGNRWMKKNGLIF